MLRGFYTAATGMLTQQRKTEMLSNNLANANTPGYKTDQAAIRAFPDMLLQRFDAQSVPTEDGLSIGTTKTIGSINTGVYMQEMLPNYKQGGLKETDLKTDIALLDVNMPTNPDTGITGSAFFTVTDANGETRYTRNGNFTLDAQGYLTTGSGLYVRDENGNTIQLPNDQFTINEEGYITDSNGTTTRLGIAYSDNPYTMVKEGDGLFAAENGALPSAYNTAGVQLKTQQGYLEQSNVDTAQTMTDMMTAYRSFEANQKILQAYDTSLQKTVNEVGRVG